MTLVHHKSAEKQLRREEIVSALRYYVGEPRLVGTLPDGPALCAKTMLAAFPTLRVLGLEMIDSVYQKIVQGPRFEVIRSTVEDWIRDQTFLTERDAQRKVPRKDTHFDGFFFDYYGWPTRERLSAIAEFVANDRIVHPDKPCLIAYTFQKTIRVRSGEGDRKQIDDDLRRLKMTTLDADSTSGLVRNYIWKRLGQRSEIDPITQCEYRCETESSPMLFGIVMVKKLTY